MAEYIDKEKLLQKLSSMIEYCKNDNKVNGLTALFQVGDAIMDCPAADVVEVRHSYWQCSNVRMSSRDITCKYCHRTETVSNGEEDFEYCPHCGAKMDGKDEEGNETNT